MGPDARRLEDRIHLVLHVDAPAMFRSRRVRWMMMRNEERAFVLFGFDARQCCLKKFEL